MRALKSYIYKKISPSLATRVREIPEYNLIVSGNNKKSRLLWEMVLLLRDNVAVDCYEKMSQS